MHRVVPLKFVVATLILGLTLVFAGQARAAAVRLVILQTRAHPAPEGLIEALRIQLAGSAEVSELTLSSAEVRLGDAEVERRDGTWLLWVEESGGESVVRVLGGSADSEPVTLGPALSDSPELERVVALKVGLLLERPRPRPEPEIRRTSRGAFAELRLAASNGGAPRVWLPSVGFAAGPRWASSNWLFEAHGSFALRAELDARSRVGETDVSSTYIGAGARVLRRWSRLAAGPFAEVGLETLRARGIAKDKRRGARELTAPTTTLGLQVRYRAHENLELCASGGGELWLTRERLELLGTPTVDFGRIRPGLGISAIFLFR